MPASGVNLFLNDFSGKKVESAQGNELRILCWNIRNPSIRTAMKQVLWLKEQPFDIFALTETKNSEGCNYIEKYFRAQGFCVDFPKPAGNEYGAMIISKIPFSKGFLSTSGSPRLNSVRMRDVEFVNAYVPNNRENGKQAFLEKLASSLKSAPEPIIFCGDLNIIEPNHVPHYSLFEPWEYEFYNNVLNLQLHDAFRTLYPKANEYSWVGRTGNGYRYDHCFVSRDLVPKVKECHYIHEPRLKKLSDHSGLIVEINQ